jgi:hypothetical protein
LCGIVEGKGNFIPTPYGSTKEELISNLKELIEDYQQNEGKQDKFWSNIDTDKLMVLMSY